LVVVEQAEAVTLVAVVVLEQFIIQQINIFLQETTPLVLEVGEVAVIEVTILAHFLKVDKAVILETLLLFLVEVLVLEPLLTFPILKLILLLEVEAEEVQEPVVAVWQVLPPNM
jgi:hypothetical protein